MMNAMAGNATMNGAVCRDISPYSPLPYDAYIRQMLDLLSMVPMICGHAANGINAACPNNVSHHHSNILK